MLPRRPDIIDDPLDHRPPAHRDQRLRRREARVREARPPSSHGNDDVQHASGDVKSISKCGSTKYTKNTKAQSSRCRTKLRPRSTFMRETFSFSCLWCISWTHLPLFCAGSPGSHP